jgi:hemoglobin
MSEVTDTETRSSIYEVAGGAPAFQRLTLAFYYKVTAEPLLAPLFTTFTQQHIDHVALWLGEVFGGPPIFEEKFDGHRGILSHHLKLSITPEQRARWAQLMIETAREVLPADELLQWRFAEYIEWGTEIAEDVSQPGYEIGDVGEVPRWGWEGKV